MEVKIIDETQISLIGMSFYGDPFSKALGWTEDNEIANLWRRFLDFIMQNPEVIKNKIANETSMEIHIQTKESLEKGYFETFIGTPVSKLEDVPLECLVKILPKTKYAVFTLVGQEISSDWENLFLKKWLLNSSYEISDNYHIQHYDQRFKGLDKLHESILEVYLPIRKRAKGETDA